MTPAESKPIAKLQEAGLMSFHPILAHGSFGSWDEVIFLSIAAIFLVMMGISWIRSRANTPAKPEIPPQATESGPEQDASDHFTLS
jgi:hypothetical protein